MVSSKNIATYTLVCTLFSVPIASFAQENFTLEEMIVTAQKREQSVQDVPISINAYSGETLEESGVENTLDLRMIEPSLVFTTNAAFGQPYLRGVGTDLFTPGAESSIATFVDDVYQSRTSSSVQNFFDVERVDVVKGPQGVLFGRNAVGGAINVYTNKPEPEFGGTIKATVGNYGKQRMEGVVNLPLAEDKAVLRIAGLVAQRDGYTDNTLGGDVDDEDLSAVRAHLQLNLTDNFDLLISASHFEEDSSRSLAARVNTDSGAAIADAFGAIRPEDTFAVALNEDSNVDMESTDFSIEANWDMGWASLKSISAYRELDLAITLDLDASQLDYASNQPVQSSETITQEFQLVSNRDDNLDWVFGLFYLSEDASQELNVSLNFPAVTGAPNDLRDQPGGSVDTTSYGVFGNVKYAFSDQWAINAGLRYNKDERELDFLETVSSLSTGDIFAAIPLELEDDYDEFTPRVVLEYTPNDDFLAYGSVSRGYKAGGFNTNIFQPEGFDSETLLAYEIGTKATFLNGRGRFNTAIYHYDYSDLQLNTIPPGSPVGTFQIVINAAEANIKGFEADLAIAATDALEVNMGLSFLNAEFDEFVAINPNDVAAGEVDRSGGDMPRAPSTSFNLGAQYTWNTGDNELVWQGDFRYETDQFLDPFQDELVKRDSNSTINSRLTYHWDAASVSLWGRNLTDEEIVQSALRVDGLFGAIEFYAPPRTYGLTVEYGF